MIENGAPHNNVLSIAVATDVFLAQDLLGNMS